MVLEGLGREIEEQRYVRKGGGGAKMGGRLRS